MIELITSLMYSHTFAAKEGSSSSIWPVMLMFDASPDECNYCDETF